MHAPAAPPPALLTAALAYAARGWAVFPLVPAGKQPLISRDEGGRGLLDATTNAATITAWWSATPDANIAIATGSISGFVVVDVDVDKGGEERLVELEAQHGALPPSPVGHTGGGGRHLLFAVPEGGLRNSNSKIARGIDVRGDGGYIVAPPSGHASGRAYRWSEGAGPDTTLPPMPPWLLDRARGGLRAVVPPPEPVSAPRPTADVLRRASAYLARMPEAISGSGGHDATWEAACAMVRGFGLSRIDALYLLEREYNPRCKPPWTRRELEHKVDSAAEKADRPTGYLRDVERAAPFVAPPPRRSGAVVGQAPPADEDDDIERAALADQPPAPEDPRVVVLRGRLAAIGAQDDTRPEAEQLEEQRAIVGELVRLLGAADAEQKAQHAAEEVARLRELAADDASFAPKLAEALERRRRALGIEDEQPLPLAFENVLARANRGPLRHLPTSLPTLDAATRGGLLERRLHVIAGEPDAGKTALAVQLAITWALAGVAVLWYAVDEPRDGIEDRVGQAHGLALEDLEASKQETLSALARILEHIPHLQIASQNEEKIVIEDAAERLATMKRRLGASSAVLIVDSMQTARCRAVAATSRPMQEKEKLDATIVALKEIAESGPLVLATSEVARSSYRARSAKDRTAELAAAKGSGAIEFAALTQWVMSRIGKGEHAGDVRVGVAKNKRGANEWKAGAAFRLERDPDRCTYTDRGRIVSDREDDERGSGPAKRPAVDENLDPYKARIRKALAGLPQGFNGNRDELATLAGGKTKLTRTAIAAMITSRELLIERPEGEPARIRLRRAEDDAPAATG